MELNDLSYYQVNLKTGNQAGACILKTCWIAKVNDMWHMYLLFPNTDLIFRDSY